jgi:ribosomal-protein-alanine N-acetyltransferase
LFPRIAKPLKSFLFRILETERLLLRDLTTRDISPLHKILCDTRVHPEFRSAVIRYLYTRLSAEAYVLMGRRASFQKDHALRLFAIEQRDSHRLIGTCSLNFLQANSSQALKSTDRFFAVTDSATIGYTIHADLWGNGYATEATHALLRHIFVDCDLPRAYAGCLPENKASRRVMEKVGMVYEGTKKGFPNAPSGKAILVFSIDRSAWQAS